MMTAFYIKASLRKNSHRQKGLQQPTNFVFTTLVSGVTDGCSENDCVMSVCCSLELCHSYLIKNDKYQRWNFSCLAYSKYYISTANIFMLQLFMFCVMKGLNSPIMIHVKYMLYLTYHLDWLKCMAKEKNHIIEMTN